ncbi:MAG: HicB family protein [Anaerolinea sp.]|nr:HicB family protein [Anaerolinea sp.]
MLFHVTLETGEDGWVVAECPALPGCLSQGKDEQEALANIKEAITAWLWAGDQKALRQMEANGSTTSVVVAI